MQSSSLYSDQSQPANNPAAAIEVWKWAPGAALLIVLVFFISGVMTLPNYGITWDEGLGNMFFGERYFRYFTSLDPQFLNFESDPRALASTPLPLNLSPFRDRPNEFPPLADTLSAATLYIFSYWLGWLNPIDGFHLFTVILSAIFLWTIFRFMEPRFGSFRALLAVLFLAVFPRFWGDMHFNVKDVPEMIFFSWTIMAYWTWYEKQTWWRALAAGILMGCAVSIKANAIFIPFILLGGLIPWQISTATIRVSLNHLARLWRHYGLMALSGAAFYWAAWPYLYHGTLTHLKGYWGYIFSQGGRSGSTWNLEPLTQAVTTAPEIFLAAVCIGFIYIFGKVWRDRAFSWQVLILWAIFPILRISIPGAVNFDGIRHFMEYVPAWAILAAFGAAALVDFIGQKAKRLRLAVIAAFLVLFALNSALIFSHYFPFLHLYYNQLTGGLSGAHAGFLGNEASDYWAGSYRDGMNWLNQNAPAQASVRALIAPWIVELSAPVVLRGDLQAPSELPDFEAAARSPIPYYMMFILRNGGSAQDEIDYVRLKHKLVYQEQVDGLPVLEIYQLGGK